MCLWEELTVQMKMEPVIQCDFVHSSFECRMSRKTVKI